MNMKYGFHRRAKLHYQHIITHPLLFGGKSLAGTGDGIIEVAKQADPESRAVSVRCLKCVMSVIF